MEKGKGVGFGETATCQAQPVYVSAECSPTAQ